MQRAIASTTDGQYFALHTNPNSVSFLDVVVCWRCDNLWYNEMKGSRAKPQKTSGEKSEQTEGQAPVLFAKLRATRTKQNKI